jgi:hypothetical protein
MVMRRGDPAQHGEHVDGWKGRSESRQEDLQTAVEELDRGLQRVVVSVFLGQERGRVRYIPARRVQACRNREQRGSRERVVCSSSSQVGRKFSSSLTDAEQGGYAGVSGRAR